MKKYLAGITAEEKKDENRISGLTAVYLRKIEELCRERQVNLYVIPSPLEDNIKNHNWQAFLQDIKEWGYEGLLKNYAENVRYYPRECFSDGVHFKKDFLQENRDEIIKKIKM